RFMAETILIVDDEEQIRASVRGVLADEGFRVLEADNGRTALAVIAKERPQLVLLDIWMPDVDGIETLREIQKRHPETRVVVIAGHGNIETAVRATQLGAIDFLEKPFSIDRLLERVERALGVTAARRLEDEAVTTPTPMPAPAAVGRTSRARTLARSVVINGHGLHSGVRTGLILHPAPPGTGVLFDTISGDVEIPALVSYVRSTGYATTLFRSGAAAQTVEHLLATLHAFGITNLRIKMQGEIPILDGSALEFCDLVDSGGVELQEEEIPEIVIDH